MASETIPLDNFKQVRRWQKTSKRTALNLASRSHAISGSSTHCFQSFIPLPQNIRKTIYCHDLKGGYLEDRFCEGSRCEQFPYTFLHWSQIDTFVYFSHHFLTIPPFSWIEAAHRHGVKVLGTIITEWDEGEELCNEILSSEESTATFISKCVAIMTEENFDGWLLNIENKLDSTKIPLLLNLVNNLSADCHKSKRNSEVIWYDSLTKDGNLEWQNELNDKNKMFFDACDGIFLNYTWKVDEEHDSLQASIDSLENGEKSRVHDIFVGVDVFGRGCFGGGGFNSSLALEKIKERDLSVAIFAPSWTYEKAEECKEFISREFAFWKLLTPFLNFRGLALDVNEEVFLEGKPRRIFFTKFCTGTRKLEDGSWSYNLGEQDCQPPFHVYPEWPQNDCTKLVLEEKTFYHSDHFKGQGLHVTVEDVHIIVPLMICSFQCPSDLFVLVSYHEVGTKVSTELELATLKKSGELNLFPTLSFDDIPQYILDATESNGETTNAFFKINAIDSNSIIALGLKFVYTGKLTVHSFAILR